MSSINCPVCQVRVWDKYQGELVKNEKLEDTIYCVECAKFLKKLYKAMRGWRGNGETTRNLLVQFVEGVTGTY